MAAGDFLCDRVRSSDATVCGKNDDVRPCSAARKAYRGVKPSFHMIAHDRRIAENTASNRQRLYGNTFQRSGECERSYASATGDRERSYGN